MRRAILAAMAGFAVLSGMARAQNVVTYHNALDRSGDFTVPGLTLAAAEKLHLDTGFHAAVSGNVYAQPLYWKPSGAKVGLLIIATESNLVYALNADTGAQVWKTQLATPAPNSALPCGDIDPEGITSAPVIDPATGTLYLDAMSLQGAAKAPRQMVYALSLTDGKVLPHWPIDVDTAMAARHTPFYSDIEGNRGGLQLFKGKLYNTYAGRGGDCGDAAGHMYHGVVVEFTPSEAAITASWATRADRGGIWSQGGVTSDGTSLYATTGNTSAANTWGDGEAVVRLKPGLAHSVDKADYFTPANWLMLDDDDLDLGGTAALPITVPGASGAPVPRVMAFGKDGHVYLLNGANLGGIGHALANEKLSNSVILTAPAVLKGVKNTFVAFSNRNGVSSQCSGSNMTMLKVAAENPVVSVDWCAPFNGNGAPIITTTNGGANSIVWVTGAESDNLLHGFSALTGKVVFGGGGVTMTGLRRFSTLIAANRHLYVPADGTIYAFAF